MFWIILPTVLSTTFISFFFILCDQHFSLLQGHSFFRAVRFLGLHQKSKNQSNIHQLNLDHQQPNIVQHMDDRLPMKKIQVFLQWISSIVPFLEVKKLMHGNIWIKERLNQEKQKNKTILINHYESPSDFLYYIRTHYLSCGA